MRLDNIDDILASLTLKSSYWAMVISKLDKKEYKEDTFIIGVGFGNDSINLLYNIDKLKHIDISVIDKFLEHEVMHIFNNHYSRAIQLKIKKEDDKLKYWNIATDMSNNSLILDMPKSLMIDDWKFEPYFPENEDFEEGHLSEYYYEKLLDRYKENEQSGNDDDNSKDNQQQENTNGDSNDGDEQSKEDGAGNQDANDTSKSKSGNVGSEGQNRGNPSKEDSKGNGQGSDDSCRQISGSGGCRSESCSTRDGQSSHEHWTGDSKLLSDPNYEYIATNKFRKIIEDSTREYTQSFGTMPGDLQVMIDKFLQPPKLPYYEMIKKFVVGSRLGKQKISYSNLNRKRMYVFTEERDPELKFLPPFPGKKKDKSFNIGILLDTSASVPINDNGIGEALKGLESILKNDKDSLITLLQVDTEIREEVELKNIKDIHRISVKGRGGTRLMPGLNRLKELKVDVSIVFTDGYCEDITRFAYSLPKKILWVMPEEGSTMNRIGNIGKVIHFPIN